MEMESDGLIRWGRPRKYSHPRQVTLYLDDEILKELDKQKGSLSRSEYLGILLKRHKEIGEVLRENEELKRRIKKLEMTNAKLNEKLKKCERIIQLSKESNKERNKIKDKKKNLENIEQIRNDLTKFIDLKNKLNKERDKRKINELNREIKRISNKYNQLLDKKGIDKAEFWKLVNSGDIEEAIKLLTS